MGEILHINDFQSIMRHIYLHRDIQRGISGTYDWLVDEVEELGRALDEMDKGALENEFADVMAWLASLANIAGVDLESATLRKYNHRCPKCGQAPCECGS